jgi:hypothetical protein
MWAVSEAGDLHSTLRLADEFERASACSGACPRLLIRARPCSIVRCTTARGANFGFNPWTQHMR